MNELLALRYTLNEVFFHGWGERRKMARHIGLTLGVTTTTLLVALVVPNISVVFSLMGGTASAYVCFIIPAAAALRLSGSRGAVAGSPCRRNAGSQTGSHAADQGIDGSLTHQSPSTRSLESRVRCLCLLLFGVMVGVLSTTTTIAELFQQKPPLHGACDTPIGGEGYFHLGLTSLW